MAAEDKRPTTKTNEKEEEKMKRIVLTAILLASGVARAQEAAYQGDVTDVSRLVLHRSSARNKGLMSCSSPWTTCRTGSIV